MKTQSTFYRRVLTIAIFAALSSGAATVASAAEGDALQTKVKFDDLNVSSTQGASILYSRIHAAAEKVCRPLDESNLASKALHAKCMNAAIANAVGKVDQPSLFAVYNAKTGTSKPIVLASSQTR